MIIENPPIMVHSDGDILQSVPLSLKGFNPLVLIAILPATTNSEPPAIVKNFSFNNIESLWYFFLVYIALASLNSSTLI